MFMLLHFSSTQRSKFNRYSNYTQVFLFRFDFGPLYSFSSTPLLSYLPVLLFAFTSLPKSKFSHHELIMAKGTSPSKGNFLDIPPSCIKYSHFKPPLCFLRKAVQLGLAGLMLSWTSSQIQLMTSHYY